MLEQAHVFAHLDSTPRDIDKRIDHELARAVIGDFAAALDTQQRDARIDFRAMRVPGPLAQRVDRRMLQQPQFVRGRLRALCRELPHRRKRFLVVHAAEPANDGGGYDCLPVGNLDHQSTMTTAGCAQSSR